MKSTIKEVFYGKRGNIQLVGMTEEYNKLSDKHFVYYNKLIAGLSDEQRKLLENVLDCQNEMSLELIDEYYKEGFKIGLLIGFETCN